jgi:hypothetical protein
MHQKPIRPLLTLVALAALVPLLCVGTIPLAHAENAYTLTPFPVFTQEGNTVALVLTVNNANTSTTYRFVFVVKDPANQTSTSAIQTHTTGPNENQFSILVNYPSPSFAGSNSLVGQYNAQAVQIGSTLQTIVATSHFFYSVADNIGYERSQTVNMRASGYAASEQVTVTIVTKSTLTTVFSRTVTASAAGIVSTTWRIPVNATIDTYLLSLAGASTVKSPSDAQGFSVKQAIMNIASISSLQSTYQRTETMQFSFQPAYPDGSFATTGVALLTLARPDGRNITFTATYDNSSQTFQTSYKTSPDNQTGTWTASLAAFAYSDAYGNNGPVRSVTSSAQLNPAALTVNVGTGTNFAVGQQMSFNASITYPDGTILQSGGVGAYLLLSGSPALNETVPMVFDTNLQIWVGTFTWKPADTGGLWSLNVRASDSSNSPNTGTATRAVIVDNGAAASPGFPLYYFGIAAALIAAALLGAMLVFKRRRKTTGASLKIDLEAVKSEAGRIEGQDFFQSIRDQVKKTDDE